MKAIFLISVFSIVYTLNCTNKNQKAAYYVVNT